MRHPVQWLRFTLPLVAGIGLLSSPAAVESTEKGPPVMGNQDLIISESDLPRLQREAWACSGEVAFRLSNLYDFIPLDFKEGLYWMAIATENGYPKAFYNLGFALLTCRDLDERIRRRNIERAKFWLRRVADGGEPLASGPRSESGSEED